MTRHYFPAFFALKAHSQIARLSYYQRLLNTTASLIFLSLPRALRTPSSPAHNIQSFLSSSSPKHNQSNRHNKSHHVQFFLFTTSQTKGECSFQQPPTEQMRTTGAKGKSRVQRLHCVISRRIVIGREHRCSEHSWQMILNRFVGKCVIRTG